MKQIQCGIADFKLICKQHSGFCFIDNELRDCLRILKFWAIFLFTAIFILVKALFSRMKRF